MQAHFVHTAKQKRITIFVVAVFIAIAIVMLALFLSKPSRSIVTFCNTYKEQNAILAKSQGNTYSVRPFTHSSSSPHDFVVALSKLESAAPKEIEPDVKTLKQIFKKIDQDPSQALSASMSGLGAEDNVARWTSRNCQ